MRRFDKGPCYMEENDEGKYVLHADHAAELAAMTERAERAEKLLDAARDAARVAMDQMDVWQRACAAASLMHTKTLKDNAILRAECEAWRRWKDGYYVLYADHAADGAMLAARAATDAAGALKGVE